MKKHLFIVILVILLMGCDKNTINLNNNSNVAVAEVLQEESVVIESSEMNESVEIKRVIIAIETLHVKQEPAIDTESIDSVYLGSVYDVIAEHFDKDTFELWYQISLVDGTKGWIESQHCQKTDRELMVYNMGECIALNVSHYYEIRNLPTLEKLKGEHNDVMIYLDGNPVNDNVEFEQVGEHQVYGVYERDGKVYKTIPYSYTVLSSLIAGVYYEDMNKSSMIIGYEEKKFDIKSKINCLWLYEDDGIHAWYEIQVDNNTIAYVPYFKYDSRKSEKIKVITEVGTLEFDCKYSSYERRLINDKYIAINYGKYHLINPKNGKVLELNGEFTLVHDGKMVLENVNRQYFYDNEPYYFKLMLIDLESGDFNVLYEGDKRCVYIQNSQNTMPDDLLVDVFTVGYLSDDTWSFLDNQVKEVKIRFVFEDDKWTTIVVDEVGEVKEEELFTVYSEMDPLSSSLGELGVSDCQSLDFLNIYDIIDDDYAMWFKVVLNDGTEGYAFRGYRPEEERNILSSSEFYLLRSDGSLTACGGYFDVLGRHNVLSDYFLEQGYYTIASYYEGSSFRHIPKDVNKTEMEDKDTFFYSIPNTSFMLKHKASYSGDDFMLEIMDVNSFKTIYHIESASAYISDIIIIDDANISFIIETYESSYGSVLRYEDGEWTLITGFSFNDE